jgi:TRAP-type uncharacterized transport system substrate-binding protein
MSRRRGSGSVGRRALLRGVLLGAACIVTGAHTPYRQWQVYRQKHLTIGTSRADAPSYPLGRRIVEVLATYLPDSRARVTRGPDPWRLASLLTSGQLEVVVLGQRDVAALRAGRAPFEAFGPTELRALFTFGDYLLVCRPDFPARHAYQVALTLTEHAAEIPDAWPADPHIGLVPIHPGALAYAMGEPEPLAAAGPAAAEPLPPDHVH